MILNEGIMLSVTVLMSTYNGEKFLKEQIDSIMNQDFEGYIRLLIRDDGSRDSTKEIIKRYHTMKNREIVLIEGENVGPQKSFLSLIQSADETDFYFFSDQDDVWYPQKIRVAVEKLCKINGPACYASNYDIIISETGITKKRILLEAPCFTPIRVIMYNQIPGCVMGFNHLLMKCLKNIKINNVMMHDSMVLSFAVSIGKVIYDPESSILHRIHENNVIGEGHKKIKPLKWIKEKTTLVIKKDDFDLAEMAKLFLLTGCVKDIWVNDLVLLRDFKKSWRNTIKLLHHPDTRGVWGSRTTMSIRCKILFHVF